MLKLLSHLTLVILCLATLSPAVGAQTSNADTTQQPPATGQRHHHQHWMKDLGLSKDQRNQIRQIRKSTPKGKARRQAVMAVLTPDQQTRYRAMRGQRHAQQ